MLTWLDILGPAVAIGLAICALSLLVAAGSAPDKNAQLVAFFEFVCGMIAGLYLWHEETHVRQFQRPNGIVFSQSLVLLGAIFFFGELAHRFSPQVAGTLSLIQWIGTASFFCGAVALGLTALPFLRMKEEHRLVEHMDVWGTTTQPEYHPATPECPFPARWRMFDTMSAEIEVLDFLETLIVTVKPELVVETGSFIGMSTLRIAGGLRKNGFGKIISCEVDPIIYQRAQQSIESSGLSSWIDLRNESSLTTEVDGTIDLFFSDSDIPIREQEVRRFLPQISRFGLILMHDASSYYREVRESALRMEREGLISTVLLPTPRGLVLAQRSELRREASLAAQERQQAYERSLAPLSLITEE